MDRRLPVYLAPMTAAPIWLDRPGPHGYTTADLHALPDDGRRYELVDGSVFETTPPWPVRIDLPGPTPRRARLMAAGGNAD